MNSDLPRTNHRMLLTRYVWRKYGRRILAAASIIIAVLLVFLALADAAPADFPNNEIVTIKPGSTLSEAAGTLAAGHIIGSATLYKTLVVLLTGHRQIKSGDYLFDSSQSALEVAYRTAYGIQDLPKIKVTFYEGISSAGMAAVLKTDIPKFDSATFLALAKPLEGKLFPDTYYFYENSTPQDVIQLLTRTFEEQTKPLLLDIQASGRTPADVITMASIVEKEAASSTDRRIIAGILWKRLDMGMPLQVDAPFFYLYGKTSAELTLGDLQSDTPYNTYKYTGLPPTPIDNPGYEAIEDTVNPVKSDYLYFLSGKDGQMHYAATLAQHAANRLRYLE